MVCIETQYFSLIRILLLAVGLWPFQNSKLAWFQVILFYCISISFIICQLMPLVTSECDMARIIEIFSFSIVSICFVIEYYSFFVHSNVVKDFMIQLQHIYNELKDENEIAIIEEHGIVARHCTIGFILIIVCAVIILIIMHLWPRILDIVVPINESRSYHILFEIEYFVDKERYFYLILLHATAYAITGGVVTAAVSMMFFTYFQCICGMLRIASYRIEHAIKGDISENINWKNEKSIYERLISAINIHRKAIEFAENMMSNFEAMSLILIILDILMLSLNFFQILSSGYDVKKSLLSLGLIMGLFVCMFCATYVGQQVTDYNDHIFVIVYSLRWYETPLHIQKLILFLLQKGTKVFDLNVGGLFPITLECFAKLISSSISYFTVLYSAAR